jgi:hypothetical protein
MSVVQYAREWRGGGEVREKGGEGGRERESEGASERERLRENRETETE